MIFNKKHDNLVSISSDNDEGIRISKSNGITLTEYFVEGYNVLAEKTGNNVIYYTYDIDGLIMSMNYQDNEYFYIKNLQGDITEIVDTTGNSVAKYRYDAWGNIIYQYDDGSNISNINPYRYRGYRYDSDTGLYYLNSRYYDSSTYRFISADSVNYLDTSSEAGLNLYAYAGNNPVMYIDPSGNFPILFTMIIIGGILGGVTRGVIAYNDGERGWNLVVEIAIGTATGMVIGGAAGAVVAMGGLYLTGGVTSVFSKFTADLSALTTFGTPIGTWEDYAIAFIFGGFSQGRFGKAPSKVGGFLDIVVRPLVNQVAKIGTGRQKDFQLDKYGYDVITRGLTYGVKGPWKSFARGGIRGYWDYFRRDYFNK